MVRRAASLVPGGQVPELAQDVAGHGVAASPQRWSAQVSIAAVHGPDEEHKGVGGEVRGGVEAAVVVVHGVAALRLVLLVDVERPVERRCCPAVISSALSSQGAAQQ